jgi:hypothetical protein
MRAVLAITLSVACWVAACLQAPTAQGSRQESDPAGTYQGHAPAADAARRVFTLSLVANGTAILDTLYIGKDSVTQHGHWTRSGRQIVLTFDAIGSNQPPRPITFRYRDRQLNPVEWDLSEWGRNGPPVLYRAKNVVQGGL